MGITKTVLENLTLTHQVFIAEMGARKRGEIDELCQIVKPTLGIVGTIGEQHLQTFGSFENIKRTKKELADYVEKNGFCTFNADNPASNEIFVSSMTKYGCSLLKACRVFKYAILLFLMSK